MDVTWSGGTACTATTSAKGAFNCSYVISATPIGGTTFTATDGSGNSATATFTVTPALSATPSSGPAGTTVTFSGTGFDSTGCCGTQYSVTWMAGSISACGAGGSGDGSWSCTYTIPAGTPTGTYNFTGSDPTPHTAVAAFTVSYTPVLSIRPVSGIVGSKITLNGTGFAKSSTVTISWSSGTACTVSSSAKGAFSCAYVVTAAAIGPHSFTGVDGLGGTGVASFSILPHLTMSPTSGPAGTTVTFVGTGFDATGCCGTQYSVTWMSGALSACGAGGSGDGSWSCTYTIPAGTSSGNITFTGSDPTPNTATTSFRVSYTPSLRVTPASGVVGTSLTFTGSGFAKSSTVTISWSSGTACTVSTSATGAFSCTYTITATGIGSTTFTAIDASSGTALTSFTVLPQLKVSPTSGPAGTPVTFVGTGFDTTGCCGNQYYVTWMAGALTACGAGGSGDGSWSCTYTIPAGTAAGGYNFTGADPTPHTAIAKFLVTYAPRLAVSPTSGPIGTPLKFSGSGFAHAATVIISWSYGTACTAQTSAQGTFSCAYTVTAAPIGAQTFTGTDNASGTALATFSVLPKLTVTPSSAKAGTTVTFSGTGFDATGCCGNQYYVTWMAGALSACGAGGSGDGSWSCTYTIPASTPAGAYNFTGSDPTPHSAIAVFQVVPVLTDSPASGLVGTLVTFNGTSFAANSTVTVRWPSGTACSGTSDGSGDVNCSFTIPGGTLGGTYTFQATDSAGHSAVVRFTSPARVSVSVASGSAGAKVTFSGRGFAGGVSLSVNWSGGVACTAVTTSAGSFGCTFRVPAVPGGEYTFTATDSNLDEARTSFRIVPHLAATPGSGPVGSIAIFSGTGYSRTASVWVNWTDGNGTSGTACTATTTRVGNFACSFTVPMTAAGLYTFTANDSIGRSAAGTFTVTPLLGDSPASGSPGTAVTFTGNGFAGTSGVQLNWSGGTVCTTSTNASGGFSCTFTIPTGTALGTYTFLATDALGDSASVKFTVT